MTSPDSPSARTSRRVVAIAAAAIAIVVLLAVVLLLLPAIVRSRAVAIARDAGFTATIDRAGVGPRGIVLREVTLRPTHVPGVLIRIAEIHVGLRGNDARIVGLDAALDGTRAELEVGLGMLLAENRKRFAGEATTPRHVSVADARLTWKGFAGDGSGIEAGGIGAELESRGPGAEETRGAVGRFEIKTSRTTLGPWGASFETRPAAARARLLLDPAVPDGPSALWLGGAGGSSELTVRIQRTKFATLGIKPAELGLPADEASEVEANVEARLSATASSETKVKLDLYRARPSGFARPVDVHLEGTGIAPPGKPFDMQKTSLAVGPFAAALTGTVTPHARGLRVDAMFRASPIPCAELVKAEAKNMGPLFATLEALGESTGALRVTGAVNASGVVKLDTAAPEETTIDWLARETCGLSIFGT